MLKELVDIFHGVLYMRYLSFFFSLGKIILKWKKILIFCSYLSPKDNTARDVKQTNWKRGWEEKVGIRLGAVRAGAAMLQVKVRLIPIRLLPLAWECWQLCVIIGLPRLVVWETRCVTLDRSHFVINGFIEPLIYLDIPNKILRTLTNLLRSLRIVSLGNWWFSLSN